MGDVYPKSAKLPKGEYSLQLYLRYDSYFPFIMNDRYSLKHVLPFRNVQFGRRFRSTLKFPNLCLLLRWGIISLMPSINN